MLGRCWTRSTSVSRPASSSSSPSLSLSLPLRRFCAVASMEDIPTIKPLDLYWKLRTGERPIILDARPAREYKVFRIESAISMPAETATETAFGDIPRDRPVYIHGSSDMYGDESAHTLATKILSLDNPPPVSIVVGGPNEIRASGFIYLNDVEGEAALAKLKEEEAKAAAAAAAEAKK
eukprot:TRINITY_DN2529_c0_g1_i1.p1 TRINITY_DN2529_c0_g1~~TRINITY_DN2529_c0_g1_i1.p1  ORF type:complete len:188 (+),score=62.40 TRINITY_DN2529_c0_g1_i1:29-565(+)